MFQPLCLVSAQSSLQLIIVDSGVAAAAPDVTSTVVLRRHLARRKRQMWCEINSPWILDVRVTATSHGTWLRQYASVKNLTRALQGFYRILLA